MTVTVGDGACARKTLMRDNLGDRRVLVIAERRLKLDTPRRPAKIGCSRRTYTEKLILTASTLSAFKEKTFGVEGVKLDVTA